MNNVVISGNLARDPEVKVTQNGSVVTSVVVAVSRFFTRKDGTKDKEVAFVPCEIWDTAAKYIGENFSKGDFIVIEGSLKEQRWEQDGQNRSRLIIRINNFERGPKRKTQSTNTNAQSQSVESTTDKSNNEEVPF